MVSKIYTLADKIVAEVNTIVDNQYARSGLISKELEIDGVHIEIDIDFFKGSHLEAHGEEMQDFVISVWIPSVISDGQNNWNVLERSALTREVNDGLKV